MTARDRDIKALLGSGFFDADWYRHRYRDVELLGIEPARHFLLIGARLMRDPGPRFSTAFYVDRYPDIAAAGINPVLHYIEHGAEENRQILPPAEGAASPRDRGVPAASSIEPVACPPSPRVHAGRRPRRGTAATVLVCAHVAGKHLFGGERSLLDILDGLLSAGHNVVVAAPGAGNPAYLEALKDRSVSVVVMRYGWWRSRSAPDDAVIAAFAGVIASQRIDVVHANTIMLREPLAAARRMGIPAVVHVRELIEHDAALVDLIGEPPVEIVRRTVEGCDWLIANSDATARAFAKPEASFVIPNTADIASFRVPLGDVDDHVRIGLVSSNLPKKGILDFVALAKALEGVVDNASFVLVGPDNAHTDILKKRQAAGELPASLVFAGYRASPVEAMAELDVLVNLSHFQESFGRTVLEAMAAARPVIAYDWGALPELVLDGETGYLVPFRDVAGVARRVRDLCRDTTRLRRMGAAARRRAQGAYDKHHFAARIESAYGHILAQREAMPARLDLYARSIERDAAPERPRIAYFMWHFPVPSETFVLNELRVLVERGYDVRVYCRQSPHKDFTPDFDIQWERVSDPDELAARLVDSGRTVVHSHFTYPTVTDMVWPACEKAGVDFTFIAHAQDIFRYSNDERNRIGEIARSPRCRHVLVPSRFHREYVRERGVPPRKILINPNGVDPALYSAAMTADRAARAKRSICAIHRFTAKKGLEHLLRAGPRLAEAGISVHLYGYGELEDAYRVLIESQGGGNLHLHGPVRSRDEMLEVFREHDLFACPSVRADDGDMDGIPTVLMEAMASGLPVLATGLSGIPDLVEDEVTGILCEPTAAGIAHAVERFYALPEATVAAMVEDAAARVARDFNATRLTGALIRLWERRTIDVMIVSWNNLPELQEVVRRLYRFTSMPFHLVICDNGSQPDVAAWLCALHASQDNVTIVFNRDNAYVGPGTNICLEASGSDYAVYVCGKEGFVLDYGWEKSLVEYMDEHPGVGLAGTLCHSPSYLTGSMYPNGVALFDRFRNQDFARENPDRIFAHVQGGFFVVRRTMYEAIGGFSDEVPHSYTDVEYSYYAESRGWQLGSPPRLLALFNKTRPGLMSRIDEHVAATHPPTLAQLPLLDDIANRRVAHCNVCEWHGPSFDRREGVHACPNCGSRPSDRTLYRALAESTFTYRRLPAVGVGVGEAMHRTWVQQFQGQVLAVQALLDQLADGRRVACRDGALKLAYLDAADRLASDLEPLLAELGRVLAGDGVLLWRSGLRGEGLTVLSDRIKAACGIAETSVRRYSSGVIRYDANPLFVAFRCRVPPCAS